MIKIRKYIIVNSIYAHTNGIKWLVYVFYKYYFLFLSQIYY